MPGISATAHHELQAGRLADHPGLGKTSNQLNPSSFYSIVCALALHASAPLVSALQWLSSTKSTQRICHTRQLASLALCVATMQDGYRRSKISGFPPKRLNANPACPQGGRGLQRSVSGDAKRRILTRCAARLVPSDIDPPVSSSIMIIMGRVPSCRTSGQEAPQRPLGGFQIAWEGQTDTYLPDCILKLPCVSVIRVGCSAQLASQDECHPITQQVLKRLDKAQMYSAAHHAP